MLLCSRVHGAFLSSGVQVQVNKVAVLLFITEVELSCLFSCASSARPSYVWFKNGRKTREETPRYRGYLHPGDNVSCALKGHEGYGSPAVCESVKHPLHCLFIN